MSAIGRAPIPRGDANCWSARSAPTCWPRRGASWSSRGSLILKGFLAFSSLLQLSSRGNVDFKGFSPIAPTVLQPCWSSRGNRDLRALLANSYAHADAARARRWSSIMEHFVSHLFSSMSFNSVFSRGLSSSTSRPSTSATASPAQGDDRGSAR
jgi:hypothetical protein